MSFYHTACVERMELNFVPMFLSPSLLGCIINPIFQCRIIYQKYILFIRRIINYSHSPLCMYLTSAILRKLYAVYLHPKYWCCASKRYFIKSRVEIKVYFFCSWITFLIFCEKWQRQKRFFSEWLWIQKGSLSNILNKNRLFSTSKET